ncbi:hypothetical protein BU23DRAFT_477399, partial [Bimuria novae-zelandiae CBS 107.79]
LDKYRTKDIFVKYPSIPNCWSWKARADDIIVFLNGENTNPVSMEHHIVVNNENVTGALVFGMQRFQAGLLVEVSPKLGRLGEVDSAFFIDTIWPIVEEASKVTPAHARIEKSMVLLMSPDKPMIRSGKGTIQRQDTVELYAAEIEHLYVKAETVYSGAEIASVNIKDADAVSKFVVRTISRIEPSLLNKSEDSFFALGLDSLIAVRLIRALRHRLGRPDFELSDNYNNPTADLLTDYFVKYTTGDIKEDVTGETNELRTLLKEYEPVIAQIPKQPGLPVS